MQTVETLLDLTCYHCNQPCEDEVWLEDKVFCCDGCKTVFEILTENNLCEYYSLDTKPGITLHPVTPTTYDYLDKPEIRKKVLEFDSPAFARVRFFVPAIHCISCVWLLENLQRIEKGVLKCEVNFSSRKLCIDFDPALSSPGRLAHRLASLGYVPKTLLEDEKVEITRSTRSIITKLAVAGFAFGNIMLLSFPEYLGLDASSNTLRAVFSFLNIVLAIPVIGYSARDYFINAWQSFIQRQISIDLPIALGLLALFFRSVYDIASLSGPGYLDSLSGLVFFLLIGRWFQGKTYESMAFDRDYKSYFPLAVQRFTGSEWSPTIIYDLVIGDRIRVRNLEIVPADSNLLSDYTFIDYSFVSGESKPAKVRQGSMVYAGGRILGRPVDLVVARKTSQGHLTDLWNNPIFQKQKEQGYKKTIDTAAKWFTWLVMALALATVIFWYFYDPSRVWIVLTSVLMVACPCALALAAPFTYGSLMRVLGRNHLYLKNSDVIERMASIDAIVFDKTGTVTYTKKPRIEFKGEISKEEFVLIKALTVCSTHPLSNMIARSIHGPSTSQVDVFREHPGRGIEGTVGGRRVRIGSASFVGFQQKADARSTTVFVSIDDDLKGHFSIAISARKDFGQLVARLGKKCTALISGDNESDKREMAGLFGSTAQLVFNQSPIDKLLFIRNLQQQGMKVMMIGDGLNDAGALKQSDVGIAVTDDTGVFTPACDGILQGESMTALDRFLDLAKLSTSILKAGFVVSFLYNFVALTFAVTGHLTPLVAAVLMPISSISVVGFSTLAVNYASWKRLSKLVLTD